MVLSHIWTEHQVADIFTKSLAVAPFQRFRAVLLGEVSLNDMMQQHVKPVPTPKQHDIHAFTAKWSSAMYEPNYCHAWPLRTFPIYCGSLVAQLMGMETYGASGYCSGYESES